MVRKLWSDIEKNYLKDNAINLTIKELSDYLDRSVKSVVQQCKKLNIKYKHSKRSGFNPVGKTYGYLHVISMSHKSKGNRRTYYHCLCNKCNKSCIKVSTILSRANKNTTCGCEQHKIGVKHQQFTGFKEISGTVWSVIKRCAYDRNLDFEIDIEYIWGLFIKQNRKCALTGLDISFPITGSVVNRKKATASLDRIDNSKGYIKGNVQWVHKEINLMKWTKTQERFIELCSYVCYYNERK